MKVNYENMKSTFGQKFKSLRKLSGRTEAEVAELLKKPVATYIGLEDDSIYPTESIIRKVAKLYGISYRELFAYGE